MAVGTPVVLKSANLQDGIDFEIERERVGMMIADYVAQMVAAGRYSSPTDEDLNELRRLERMRGNGLARG